MVSWCSVVWGYQLLDKNFNQIGQEFQSRGLKLYLLVDTVGFVTQFVLV